LKHAWGVISAPRAAPKGHLLATDLDSELLITALRKPPGVVAMKAAVVHAAGRCLGESLWVADQRETMERLGAAVAVSKPEASGHTAPSSKKPSIEFSLDGLGVESSRG